MRLRSRVWWAAATLAALPSVGLRAQTPAPTPAPAAAPAETPAAPDASAAPAATTPPPAGSAALPPIGPTPVPAATALRIVETPSVVVAKLPSENPFGSTAEVPAALPPKLPFTDANVNAGFFVSIHVDPTGKAVLARRERDPIPSLAADSLKSLQRWTLIPARRAGQAVDTWGAYRLELAVEVRSPRLSQFTMGPVLPTAAVPAPFQWPNETAWLETRKTTTPNDGTVPIVEVDTAPMPQKTPWSADSFKGAFNAKYWIKVDKNGHVEKAIPLEVSDPVLLAYFRQMMNSWALRPAQSGGAPVASWNELTLAGTISYSVDLKQITALRRPIGS
jgi:hypothetical protein